MTEQSRAAYEARYQCDANDPANAADLALFVAGYEAAAGTNAPLYDPRDVAFGAVAAHGAQSALHNAACDVPGLRNGTDEAAEIIANMIQGIESKGLYSQESTLGFLTQAYYCLKPANVMIAAAPAQPAAPTEANHG